MSNKVLHLVQSMEHSQATYCKRDITSSMPVTDDRKAFVISGRCCSRCSLALDATGGNLIESIFSKKKGKQSATKKIVVPHLTNKKTQWSKAFAALATTNAKSAWAIIATLSNGLERLSFTSNEADPYDNDEINEAVNALSKEQRKAYYSARNEMQNAIGKMEDILQDAADTAAVIYDAR